MTAGFNLSHTSYAKLHVYVFFSSALTEQENILFWNEWMMGTNAQQTEWQGHIKIAMKFTTEWCLCLFSTWKNTRTLYTSYVL